MEKQQIKAALRQQAEAQYHQQLKSIDSEVDERFAQLQVELAVIDEAERRSNALYANMRLAAAQRHGLSLEAPDEPPLQVLNDPRANP